MISRAKCAITILAVLALFSMSAWAQQASITLKNQDVAYCYKQEASWSVISADVADATNGDGAISDKIVAAALQGQTTYPASIVTVSGTAATFTENTLSGSLSFTDAN